MLLLFGCLCSLADSSKSLATHWTGRLHACTPCNPHDSNRLCVLQVLEGNVMSSSIRLSSPVKNKIMCHPVDV